MSSPEEIYSKLEKMDEKIDRLEILAAECKVVLLGKNSDKGLVGQVEVNTKKINTITIILSVLAGSGALGGGIFGLIKLLA